MSQDLKSIKSEESFLLIYMQVATSDCARTPYVWKKAIPAAATWALNSGGKEQCNLGTSLQSKTGHNAFPENTSRPFHPSADYKEMFSHHIKLVL